VTSFERLSPALQYHVVNDLGWFDLRPVQKQAIETILAGSNCVILAPTAGGKTEAAFFPLLSLMDTEDLTPVSVLYLAPIRALLNNLEPRLERLAAFVGRRAFKWHGDVNSSARKRFIKEPTDILATTPESLEAMLISTKVPTRRLLGNLRAVVIDEVHAFAGDDRGGHLSALLERVTRLCRHDIQRIGLSATVGNPGEICQWLSGSSKRPQQVVDPGGVGREPELSLDYVGTLENAAVVIERLHPGRKRLVFADSRSWVEELGHLLSVRGVDTHVTHSSLSVGERRAAERAFAEGQNCVIVATSALELGIDIGDLDHVLQIESPTSVASFLQRMGRTGRRPDTMANCTFLAIKNWQLVQAAALLRLHARGFVEPVAPVRKGSHLLAHQLMALALQHSGVHVGEWWSWVEGASAFRELTAEDRAELLEHMLAGNILAQVDGRLILGDEGERLYGHRNFMDLYAVFSTPPIFKVLWGPREVGTLETFFVQLSDVKDLRFVLGGRAWRATGLDWKRGLCFVEPSPAAGKALWTSEPRLLSYDLCQAMRDVLVDKVEDPWWSRRARTELASLRQEYTFLRDEPAPLIEESDRTRWWTFAGGKANNLLAKLLEERLGGTVRANNFTLTFTDGAAKSLAGIRQAISELAEPGTLSRETVRRVAKSCARGRISKFQPCLTDRLELELLAEALTDLEGARMVVGS
jgi:ATP-dependent Lhr-like helicase